MTMRVALAVLLLAALHVPGADAQMGSVLISKIGTKCLSALDGKVVAAACTGGTDQVMTPNFSVGGLQIGFQCLRRTNQDLALAPCKTGDVDEVFELNASTFEISNSSGKKACVDLSESAGDWRPNLPVGLHPCTGRMNQKWLWAALKPAAGKGKAKANDTLGELQTDDYIRTNGQYLVIK